FLGAGEQLRVVYTVIVDDGHGGTASRAFPVIITGTNDLPVIAAGGVVTGASKPVKNSSKLSCAAIAHTLLGGI
ncbi:MAG TPA: VCBS domain-containing protein, partial [Solirubrobacterales bacterium]|nr:VCBS domain-containing protein [Solirubrobacterales bacterium]